MYPHPTVHTHAASMHEMDGNDRGWIWSCSCGAISAAQSQPPLLVDREAAKANWETHLAPSALQHRRHVLRHEAKR